MKDEKLVGIMTSPAKISVMARLRRVVSHDFKQNRLERRTMIIERLIRTISRARRALAMQQA